MPGHADDIRDSATLKTIKDSFEDHWEDLGLAYDAGNLPNCVVDAIEEMFGMGIIDWLDAQEKRDQMAKEKEEQRESLC